MSEARLASGFEVGALRRLTEALGGSATVVRKGDEDRGQILLCLSRRGVYQTFLERTLQPSGTYDWSRVGPVPEEAEKTDSFAQRRVKFDSDSWLIDLDIPDPERFIAEISRSG